MLSKPLTTPRLLRYVFFVGVLVSAQTLAEQSGSDSQPSSLQAILASQQGEEADFLHDFYRSGNYQRAWTNPANVDTALELIGNVGDDGLEPEQFNYSHLLALRDAGDLDGLDLQLTENIARLANALRFGYLDQEQYIKGSISSRQALAQPEMKLREALAAQQLKEAILAQRPELSLYPQLREALQKYRKLAATETFQPIEQGPTLHPGDTGPRVGQLIGRLESLGYLTDAEAEDKEVYSSAVEQAVKRFQTDSRAQADGIAGPATLALLNISAAQRVDQIKANLERVRWVGKFPDQRAVLVNVAAFTASVINDGATVWSTPVIVGKDYTKTPLFTDEMRYIEFNPTWTVPRSIIRKSLAAKLIADPGYLAAHDFYLVQANGTEVDSASVNWSSLTPDNFPYWVVQKPGDQNALGHVKFMFPNSYDVYLHDTPNRELFSRSLRTFSHGCVRVDQPLRLAALLLADQGWDAKRIDDVVASRERTRVTLEHPVPIAIAYWTADFEDGQVVFFNDVYQRDPPLIAALQQSHD